MRPSLPSQPVGGEGLQRLGGNAKQQAVDGFGVVARHGDQDLGQREDEMEVKEIHNVLNLRAIVDDAKCFETVREIRWPEGVRCVHCGADTVAKHGRDETQPERQRYRCRTCNRYFDDLTGTIFEGHHQPLKVWILCLYLMGLNLSNSQIAQELDLHPSDALRLTQQLRQGVVARKPEGKLAEEVECDEVYVVAGHKGHPAAVKKRRKGRRNRLKGARGRGTLAKEKLRVRAQRETARQKTHGILASSLSY